MYYSDFFLISIFTILIIGFKTPIMYKFMTHWPGYLIIRGELVPVMLIAFFVCSETKTINLTMPLLPDDKTVTATTWVHYVSFLCICILIWHIAFKCFVTLVIITNLNMILPICLHIGKMIFILVILNKVTENLKAIFQINMHNKTIPITKSQQWTALILLLFRAWTNCSTYIWVPIYLRRYNVLDMSL